MLKIILHFLRRNAKSQMLGFGDQRLPGDQLVGSPLCEERKEHRHVGRVALGHLLAHHLLGSLTHLFDSNVSAINLGHDSLTRRAHQIRSKATGNKCDDHGGADHKQNAAQDDFLGRPLGLQKTNHFLSLQRCKLNSKL